MSGTAATAEKTIRVGNRVLLTEKNIYGTVAYVGTTLFQPGKWIGVVLDEPQGNHNGVVKNKEYFKCKDNHGLFVRPVHLVLVENDSQPAEKAPAGKDTSAAAPSGLRQPQSKRPATAKDGQSKETSPATESKMKAPTKSSVPSKLSSAASTEKLRQSPSTEKLASGLRSSPSSDKINVSTKPNDPPRPTKLPSPDTQPDPSKMPAKVSETRRISTVDSIEEPPSPTPSVAAKVARLQQDISRSSVGNIGVIGRIVPPNLSEGAELEYLRAEAKDLTEKLETLRSRRTEDKKKLIDYEKCQIELQQHVEYKAKMTKLYADLQKQLQDARKDAKEAIEARQAYQEEMSDLGEAIEMATVDKEMAEEKAEALQQELEKLQERNKELELSIGILKNKMQDKGADGGAVTPYQVEQLEQQNERLREALIKLRNLSANEHRDTQRLAKELESLKSLAAELQKKNDKLSQEVQQYEQQTAELKEQVDAALGSETMIEQLTTKNLALEERVLELEETMEDFEQMRQMDEELQESAKETEKELRRDLDMANGKINELKHRMQQSHSQLSDHEMTIRKFREHTAQLQEQIQDLKDKLMDREARKETGDGETGVSKATWYRPKTTTELVEDEMRKLELENSSQHIRYLQSFMPDNFAKFGGDNDALLVTLFFPRVAGKAQLLINQLNDKFAMATSGIRREHVVKSHKAEQWSFVAMFTYQLNTLILVLHKYESILSQCSVERLNRLAKLQPEMIVQEKLIDYYFELLKTNRIDENTSLENVEKFTNYLQNLFSVHLVSEQLDNTVLISDTIRQLLSGISWFNIELTRARFYLLGDNLETSSLWKTFDEMKLFVGDAEQFLRQAKTRIPQDTKTHVLKPNDEIYEHLHDAATNLEKASRILHLACKNASTEVSMLPDVEGVDLDRMDDHLQRAVEKLLGKGAESKSAQDIVKIALGLLLSRASKLADAIGNGQFDAPAPETKPFPPILERAHARKQDAVEIEGLRWQIEKKENEIIELKKALRLKAEEISEMNVRKEMAEKRLATSGKEGDERVLSLQRKVEELQQDCKKKEREFEQTMDFLQQEIDSLEKKNSNLESCLQHMSKKAMLQGISAQPLSPSSVGSTSNLSSPGAGVQDSPMLLQQIDHLKTALILSNQAKCAVEAENMHRTLASLPPLNVPQKVAGKSSKNHLIDMDQLSHKRHDDLNHILRETVRLQKNYQMYVANMKVVDVSKRKPGTEPAIEKQTPVYQLSTQLQEARKLDEWIKDLNVRMQRYRAAQLCRGVNSNQNFASFPSPVCARESGSSDVTGQCLARIVIPSTNKSEAGRVINVKVTPTEFHRLHTLVVQ